MIKNIFAAACVLMVAEAYQDHNMYPYEGQNGYAPGVIVPSNYKAKPPAKLAHVVNPHTDAAYYHDPHYDHHADRYHTIHHEAPTAEYTAHHHTAPMVAKHEHFGHIQDHEELTDKDFDYTEYRKEKLEQKEMKHQMKEQERLEKEHWKQEQHEAKMQRKAEKYQHRYDPHPVYVHRDVHHHLDLPHLIETQHEVGVGGGSKLPD